MIVGILTLQLFFGEAVTLKDKRRALKSIIDQVRARFNVSVAEVGEQDLWQRSTVGVSFVSSESAYVHKVFAAVVRLVEGQGEVSIIDYKIELL